MAPLPSNCHCPPTSAHCFFSMPKGCLACRGHPHPTHAVHHIARKAPLTETAAFISPPIPTESLDALSLRTHCKAAPQKQLFVVDNLQLRSKSNGIRQLVSALFMLFCRARATQQPPPSEDKWQIPMLARLGGQAQQGSSSSDSVLTDPPRSFPCSICHECFLVTGCFVWVPDPGALSLAFRA